MDNLQSNCFTAGTVMKARLRAPITTNKSEMSAPPITCAFLFPRRQVTRWHRPTLPSSVLLFLLQCNVSCRIISRHLFRSKSMHAFLSASNTVACVSPHPVLGGPCEMKCRCGGLFLNSCHSSYYSSSSSSSRGDRQTQSVAVLGSHLAYGTALGSNQSKRTSSLFFWGGGYYVCVLFRHAELWMQP
jgi:hypothetical protein